MVARFCWIFIVLVTVCLRLLDTHLLEEWTRAQLTQIVLTSVIVPHQRDTEHQRLSDSHFGVPPEENVPKQRTEDFHTARDSERWRGLHYTPSQVLFHKLAKRDLSALNGSSTNITDAPDGDNTTSVHPETFSVSGATSNVSVMMLPTTEAGASTTLHHTGQNNTTTEVESDLLDEGELHESDQTQLPQHMSSISTLPEYLIVASNAPDEASEMLAVVNMTSTATEMVSQTHTNPVSEVNSTEAYMNITRTEVTPGKITGDLSGSHTTITATPFPEVITTSSSVQTHGSIQELPQTLDISSTTVTSIVNESVTDSQMPELEISTEETRSSTNLSSWYSSSITNITFDASTSNFTTFGEIFPGENSTTDLSTDVHGTSETPALVTSHRVPLSTSIVDRTVLETTHDTTTLVQESSPLPSFIPTTVLSKSTQSSTTEHSEHTTMPIFTLSTSSESPVTYTTSSSMLTSTTFIRTTEKPPTTDAFAVTSTMTGHPTTTKLTTEYVTLPDVWTTLKEDEHATTHMLESTTTSAEQAFQTFPFHSTTARPIKDPSTTCVKTLDDLTADEKANLVTITMYRSYSKIVEWFNEEERDFRKFLILHAEMCFTTQDSKENGTTKLCPAPGSLTVNDITYVAPTPFLKEGHITLTFIIRNTSDAGKFRIVPAQHIISNLQSHPQELKSMNITSVFKGAFSSAEMSEESFQESIFERYAPLFITLIAISAACLVIILIAVTYQRLHNSRTFVSMAEKGVLGGDCQMVSETGLRLTPEAEILREESQMVEKDCKVLANGNGVPPGDQQDEGWVVPFSDAPAEERSPVDIQDTKL